MLRRLLPLIALSLLATGLQAEIQTEVVNYRQGGEQLRGYLAWDDTVTGKRPGILVVHEWWGLNDYIKRRTKMLAQLGYVAFAVDMYGDGRTTEHGDQAKEWMEQISANAERWRQRAQSGLDTLRRQKLVDPQRVAAIGYCFGGGTVLQLAYGGADLDGIVSFHGTLPVPSEAEAANIRAQVLVHQGSEDQFVPPEQVQRFQTALDRADVDWRMVIHGGARHAFTNPNAGQYGIENLRYDKLADKRSWEDMQLFFNELFAQP